MVGRPTLHSDLKPITLLVDRESLKLAKEMNINISQLLRKAIAEEIGDDRKMEEVEIYNKTIKKARGVPKDYIKNLIETSRKHPDFLQKALDNVNKECGTKLTPEDVKNLIPRY